MNWVGGARSRIKQNQERRKQQEFFERRRFENNLVNKTDPTYQLKSKLGISQDLFNVRFLHSISEQRKFPKLEYEKSETKRPPSVYHQSKIISELPISPMDVPNMLPIDDDDDPSMFNIERLTNMNSKLTRNKINDDDETSTKFHHGIQKSKFPSQTDMVLENTSNILGSQRVYGPSQSPAANFSTEDFQRTPGEKRGVSKNISPSSCLSTPSYEQFKNHLMSGSTTPRHSTNFIRTPSTKRLSPIDEEHVFTFPYPKHSTPIPWQLKTSRNLIDQVVPGGLYLDQLESDKKRATETPELTNSKDRIQTPESETFLSIADYCDVQLMESEQDEKSEARTCNSNGANENSDNSTFYNKEVQTNSTSMSTQTTEAKQIHNVDIRKSVSTQSVIRHFQSDVFLTPFFLYDIFSVMLYLLENVP